MAVKSESDLRKEMEEKWGRKIPDKEWKDIWLLYKSSQEDLEKNFS